MLLVKVIVWSIVIVAGTCFTLDFLNMCKHRDYKFFDQYGNNDNGGHHH